jgi:uncharacterized membrane-anchored protein YhcB (DUF1043 family)
MEILAALVVGLIIGIVLAERLHVKMHTAFSQVQLAIEHEADALNEHISTEIGKLTKTSH